MEQPHIKAENLAPFNVCILGLIHPGAHGGIEQAVYGTVAALGKLVDGDEQYTVVVDPAAPRWLDAACGLNTRIIVYPRPAWRTTIWRILEMTPGLNRAYHGIAEIRKRRPANLRIAQDEFLDSLGADVYHFPYQWFRVTNKPSLFDPQDVQHMHHPEFFSPSELEARSVLYPQWCDACSMIEVPTPATKGDLVGLMGVEPTKVAVVPKGPPIAFESADVSDPANLVRHLDLPREFMLYPAQTWPHKNHIRLLEAIALLRDQSGLRLNVVCTGRRNDFWPTVRQKADELRLSGQVRFLGHIPTVQLKALYHLAEFTVFPTLFEGGGFPLLEAFHEGSPIACSNIPVLVDQASGAALLFDPKSADSMAGALQHLHCDPDLRASLRQRGLEVAQHHTWERTARTYRALYRSLASRDLTDDDKRLIKRATS